MTSCPRSPPGDTGVGRDTIAALKDTGTTIILTTHHLDEAEHLADRVAVISDGRLVSHGSPHDLARRQAAATIRFTLPAGVEVDELPDQIRHGAAGAGDGTISLPVAAPLAVLSILADWAGRAGHDLPDLEVRRPSLEDVYLQLTGDQEAQATP